jgi:hypothetical protein
MHRHYPHYHLIKAMILSIRRHIRCCDLLIPSPTLGLTMRLLSRMSCFLLLPVSFGGRIIIAPMMKVVPAFLTLHRKKLVKLYAFYTLARNINAKATTIVVICSRHSRPKHSATGPCSSGFNGQMAKKCIRKRSRHHKTLQIDCTSVASQVEDELHAWWSLLRAMRRDQKEQGELRSSR